MAEQQMPEAGTEYCSDGKHYIRDGSTFVHVGECEDPKHQVINAANKASQAIQGAPQEGAAIEGESFSPSNALNKKLGVGDPKSLF